MSMDMPATIDDLRGAQPRNSAEEQPAIPSWGARSDRFNLPAPVGARRDGTETTAGSWNCRLASSQILDEAMPGDHDPGVAVLLEPAHRMQPRLEAAVVGLDLVVGIPVGAMPDRRQQLLDHRRVHRRVVGDHLDWRDPDCADGALEEPAGRGRVPPGGHEHVDDLPELVDRPVDIAPQAGDLDRRP
jgi:hypothetical protein